MMEPNTIAPHAFSVWWKDFDYWQVRALWLALTNKCRWPTVRLGDIVTVRSEVVPDDDIHDGKVRMLDRISFDEGRVFFGKRTKTRMLQFTAKPGDIVVSKINARKRAIGIVQDGTDVGVTIHFRALIPNTEKVDAEFLWASLRSIYCSQQFEVDTGGIGKGEISEERLLAIAVPLPTSHIIDPVGVTMAARLQAISRSRSPQASGRLKWPTNAMAQTDVDTSRPTLATATCPIEPRNSNAGSTTKANGTRKHTKLMRKAEKLVFMGEAPAMPAAA